MQSIRGIGTLQAAALALASATASAQQPPSPPAYAEKIEVTGTNIPRALRETGLPVQVIGREEIEKSGIQTTQDLLDRISAHMSFGAWSEALGVGDLPGFTGASLRGLGSQRTLVLLNGRRLAPYALSGGQSVDLSAIPLAAIERVEVLKDGASAVYGTDAIGGVVNFIMRRDFRGVELNANYHEPQHAGGDHWRAGLALGFGDPVRDRFNAFLSVDRYRQDALRAADRPFSRTSYLPEYGFDATSAQSFPANIFQPFLLTPLRNPTIPASGATASSCLAPFSFPTRVAPRQCRFDYASVIETVPEVEKTNVFGRATWAWRPDATLFAEGSYYRGEFVYRISPTPVSSAFTRTPMTLPPDSPFYPAAFVRDVLRGDPTRPLSVAYRTIELGPRVNAPVSEQWRAILGMQGRFRDWDYEMAAGYNANRQVDRLLSGYLSEDRFGPLLRSGVVNPFAPNTPEVLERMRATQIVGDISRNKASHLEADMKVSGTPYELPAGPLALAAGFGARRERLEQVNEPVLFSGDIIGGAGAIPSLEAVHRTVGTLFGEVNVPLVRSLEANVAVRMDRYSDFGRSNNAKGTLRWQVSQRVLLRASYGSGFRAPTLSDLFQPDYLGFAFGFDDPERCPVTNDPADCGSQLISPGFRTVAGGNPTLEPERSKQLNFGFVLEPFRGLSLSADYYDVRIRDVIMVVPPFAVFADYARWAPTHIHRLPPDPEHPDLPGRIQSVSQKQFNVGDMRSAGFDVDASWSFNAGRAGRFVAVISGTYVARFEVQEFEPIVSGPGMGLTGAISRWRHHASLDWARGPWGITLAQTFQRGYREIDLTTCPGVIPTLSPSCGGTRRVGSLEVFDLQARFAPTSRLTLGVGVRNLLDRAPPLALTPRTFQIGYDASYGDPRGRIYYATVRYSWR